MGLCAHVLAYVTLYHLPAYANIVIAYGYILSILGRLGGQLLHEVPRWQMPLQRRRTNQCFLSVRTALESPQGKLVENVKFLWESDFALLLRISDKLKVALGSLLAS